MRKMPKGLLLVCCIAALFNITPVPVSAEHLINVSNITGEYNNYSSDLDGGAISNTIVFEMDNASFDGNTTSYNGGAVRANISPSAGISSIKNSSFSNNTAVLNDGDSGAISIGNGIYTISDSTFTSNKAVWAGAIYAYTGNKDGVSILMNNVTFEKNEAAAIGAVGNFASQKILASGGMTILNSTFTENKAADSKDDGGGAMFLGAESVTLIDNVLFDGNISASRGGAISTRSADLANNSAAKLDILHSTFQNNEAAAGGGAIDNYFYNSTAGGGVKLMGNKFINNSAKYGGAIYNHGETDKGGNTASIIIDSSSFENNHSKSTGGAIYNAAKLAVSSSQFKGNYTTGTGAGGGAIGNTSTGTMTIGDKVTFESNTAKGYGGAIYNLGTVKSSGTDISFTGNSGTSGGAIYNSKGTSGVGLVEISDAVFTGNTSTGTKSSNGGGAIYNASKSTVTIGDNVKFNQNIASVSGGALYNLGDMSIGDSASFNGNTSKQYGGAIYNTGTLSSIGKDSSFTSNTSGFGGAIYSKKDLTIGSNVAFSENTAKGYTTSQGGAIYVNGASAKIGDNAKFLNNTATVNGGAISADGGKSLEIGNGAVFSSNIANLTSKYNGLGGAIYANTDTLTIGAESTFSSNSAFQGGAIYNNADTITIGDGAKFSSNTAVQGGAILQNSNSELTLNNAEFSQNSAAGNETQSAGGAIFLGVNDKSPLTITNSLFDSNSAGVVGGAVIQANGSTSVMTFENTSFINNTAGKEGGAIASDSSLIVKGSIFEGNKTLNGTVGKGDDGGGAIMLYDESKAAITDSTFKNNSSTTYGGAIGTRTGASSEKSSLTIDNSYFDSNSASVSGGAINSNIDTVITDSSFVNNSAAEKGGAISTAANLTIKAVEKDVVFSGNSAKDGGDIYIDSEKSAGNQTLNLVSEKDKTISISGGISGSENGYDVNITGDGTTKLQSYIKNANMDVSGTLWLAKGSEVNGNNNTIHFNDGSTLSTLNDKIDTFEKGLITINGEVKLNVDVDLKTGKTDFFGNAELYDDAKVVVNSIKAIPNTTKSKVSVNLNDALGIDSSKLQIDESSIKLSSIMSPIKKMNGSVKDGVLTYAAAGGNNWRDYNPSVLSAPVAAITGAYLTLLNSYDQAFMNMDMYMLMTYSERQAFKFANKYAAAQTSAEDNSVNIPSAFNLGLSSKNSNDAWFRPYATFEKVGLKNGPKVSNQLYGSFFGGDSKLYDLPHGWDGMYSVYVAYNGSHQSYNGISIYQNGVQLGFTGMAYKGNFFAGITANVGANIADASNYYGSEDFTMLLAGAALKTGYNFEMANGKFIIQPHVTVSYAFVNSFDYTNSAGVRIKSDPLNAIAIQPGVKLIGNLKKGWQPYAGISLVWNFLDEAKFRANDVSLPEMSIKPFIRYGIGVQKRVGERFTGFGQLFFNTLGRSGIGFSFGFKWALGKTKGLPLPQPVYVK